MHVERGSERAGSLARAFTRIRQGAGLVSSPESNSQEIIIGTDCDSRLLSAAWLAPGGAAPSSSPGVAAVV
jgi:hypothetical protein